jgi:hypothetical protein
MFYNKYLKYKKKYLEQKGGMRVAPGRFHIERVLPEHTSSQYDLFKTDLEEVCSRLILHMKQRSDIYVYHSTKQSELSPRQISEQKDSSDPTALINSIMDYCNQLHHLLAGIDRPHDHHKSEIKEFFVTQLETQLETELGNPTHSSNNTLLQNLKKLRLFFYLCGTSIPSLLPDIMKDIIILDKIEIYSTLSNLKSIQSTQCVQSVRRIFLINYTVEVDRLNRSHDISTKLKASINRDLETGHLGMVICKNLSHNSRT